MGLLDKLVVGGAAALLGTGIIRAVRSGQETARRKNSPLQFDSRLTQLDFVRIAEQIARATPRVTQIEVSGLVATIFVRSTSGLSTWSAEIDFNDYGRPTGKYWINSENDQSQIPAFFADALQQQMRERVG